MVNSDYWCYNILDRHILDNLRVHVCTILYYFLKSRYCTFARISSSNFNFLNQVQILIMDLPAYFADLFNRTYL